VSQRRKKFASACCVYYQALGAVCMLPVCRTCLEVKCRDATFSDNYGNQFNRVGMCLNSDSVKVSPAPAVWLRTMTALIGTGERSCHRHVDISSVGD